MGSLLQLFDYTGLIPHGHCFLWRTDLVWLHVVSDSLIALAYYSIPISLGVFVWKRRENTFNWLFLLFAAFIFACGTTHVMSVVTLWNPIYGYEGIVKLITALVSMTTAVLLLWVLPEALALPGLKQANEKLRVVTDALPALISFVDRDEVYRMNNHQYEEWFGLGRDELRGRTVREVVGDDFYDRLHPHVRAALRGNVVRFSERLPLPSGEERDIDAVYVPEVVDGEVRGFYALISDVSDRKRAEAAERESERLRVLAETAGAAAHEINQPLTSLLGETELLLRKDCGETRETLETIHRSAQRISEIVSKMKNTRQYVTKPYMPRVDIVDFEGSSAPPGDDA